MMIAEHDDLGGSATHERDDRTLAAVAVKHRLGERLDDARAAAAQEWRRRGY